MKAEDFRLQFPPGFEHDVPLVLATPNQAWQGKVGKFVRDAGDFVIVEVDGLYHVRLPWAQVSFKNAKVQA